MPSQEPGLSLAERSRLVAYLDGELDEVEAREVAANLTLSPVVRREVEAMQRAWELLDLLPRPEPSVELGSRTLSEARRVDGGDRTRQRRSASRTARLAACAAAAALAVAFGYASARWLWPDPVARLDRDLPLAEHLDEYREVGSFDFLEDLVRSREFEDREGSIDHE